MACREENAVRRFVLNEGGEEVVVLEINVGGPPDVNHFCRFCSKYLKINGVLCNTELIFDQSELRQNVAEKAADLGLLLKRSKNKSTRVCRTCVFFIDRLRRHLAVFRKWKEEEEKVVDEETASPSASSDPSAKRDSPSFLTKPLPKKPRTNPPPPQHSRKSVTQVITTFPSKTTVKVPSESEAGIIQHIANQNWKTAANLLSSHKELFDEIKSKVLVAINEESHRFSNSSDKCLLWKTTPDDLKSFSLDNLVLELERRAPFLLSIFRTIANNNNEEAACAALCIALRGRKPGMSAFAYHINSIIAHGGIKKAAFKKLSKLAITTSYSNAIIKQKEMMGTKGTTCGETPAELEVPSEPLQNPVEEMDGSADPEEQD